MQTACSVRHMQNEYQSNNLALPTMARETCNLYRLMVNGEDIGVGFVKISQIFSAQKTVFFGTKANDRVWWNETRFLSQSSSHYTVMYADTEPMWRNNTYNKVNVGGTVAGEVRSNPFLVHAEYHGISMEFSTRACSDETTLYFFKCTVSTGSVVGK